MSTQRPTEQLGFGPQEFLAAIVESSNDAIIGKTLDGEMTSWNRAAERLYGYTAEEAIGRHISILVPGDLPDEIPTIMSRLSRGERIEHYETKRLRKDGELVDVSVTISPILDEEGRVVGASSIARDIRERLEAEKVERYALELEAAHKAMEDFVAMAAHDLRTPITVIQGFAQTMSEAWEELGDDQKVPYLSIMTRQAGHLATLVSDLLMASRLESEVLATEPEVITLDRCVEEVLEDLGERAKEVEVDMRHPTSVFVDPQHLNRILHNLLSNAFRYGRPPVRILATDSETAVEIAVSDEGEGIPEEFVPRLFEKFTRVDKTLSREKGGTGLGLAIVHGLARANGGEVWYERNEPTGSIFYIRLPMPV